MLYTPSQPREMTTYLLPASALRPVLSLAAEPLENVTLSALTWKQERVHASVRAQGGYEHAHIPMPAYSAGTCVYNPLNSEGQNTGMGSCFLLQGIISTQGLNPGLPHCIHLRRVALFSVRAPRVRTDCRRGRRNRPQREAPRGNWRAVRGLEPENASARVNSNESTIG